MTGRSVLVVDDEAAVHRFMAPALIANGYEPLRADNAAEALFMAADRRPSIIILDLGLPDLDGKEVIRRLRGWTDTPIVVLSARDREAEKIEALDLGADDFVNKPFGMGELMARLRAALRHRTTSEAEPVLFVGGIEIDLPRHQVTRHGQEVKLTRKEFDLFAFLASQSGKVVTHQHLLRQVWGPAHVHDTQYLRVYIGQLRTKLEDDPASPRMILTEPGIGYRIVSD